ATAPRINTPAKNSGTKLRKLKQTGRSRGFRRPGNKMGRFLAPALHYFNWLRGLDLNQRPSGYEPDELPDCSTPQRHDSGSGVVRQTDWTAYKKNQLREASAWASAIWRERNFSRRPRRFSGLIPAE